MAKSKEFVWKNIRWIILFFCMIGFIAIAENVFNNEIMKADIVGYNFVAKYFISDFATPIAKAITAFGSAMFLISITVILVIAIRNKKIPIAVFLNLVIVAGLNFLFKNILQRPRPTEFRLINETGFSFPSGHSMVSLAFYGLFIYLIYKYIKNKKLKWGLICVLSVLIILIGISRIYLGVHYTSDVIGGFLLGVSYLIIYIKCINSFLFEQESASCVVKRRLTYIQRAKSHASAS